MRRKSFYKKYKEQAGPDLLTRLQETVTESKKTSSAVSFEGTGDFLDERFGGEVQEQARSIGRY